MRSVIAHAPPRSRDRRIVALGALGALLLAAGQTLTLVHLRPLSDYWYGVVWTGFILAADALVARRTGASLALDRPRDLLCMLVASASLWWLFEAANLLLLDSWGYTPSPDVPLWVQKIRSTYFFATLVPATWQASLLALTVTRPAPPPLPSPRSLPSLPGLPSLPSLPSTRRLALVAMAVGVGFAAAIALAPGLSLPLSLIALGLVTDALNLLRGRPSLLAMIAGGRWAVPLGISVGNIAAGFVGEMWNYPADPRWSYHVPYADVLHVFAMPLPGYLGYAALALDLFALYHLVRPKSLGRGGAGLAADHPLTLTGLG